MSTYESRNPKPTSKVGFDRRNPKPETDIRHLTLVSAYETRNRHPTSDVGFGLRNPKPETRNRHLKLVSTYETRNPKPETDIRHLTLVSAYETRNPKPTSKFGFDQRNPKPETRKRLESDFWGSSPDRNSKLQQIPEFYFWIPIFTGVRIFSQARAILRRRPFEVMGVQKHKIKWQYCLSIYLSIYPSIVHLSIYPAT